MAAASPPPTAAKPGNRSRTLPTTGASGAIHFPFAAKADGGSPKRPCLPCLAAGREYPPLQTSQEHLQPTSEHGRDSAARTIHSQLPELQTARRMRWFFSRHTL